jgi:hypothetical protein
MILIVPVKMIPVSSYWLRMQNVQKLFPLFRPNINFTGFTEKLSPLTNHSLLSFWSHVERNLLFHGLIPWLYPLACISFKGRTPFEVSYCSQCSHVTPSPIKKVYRWLDWSWVIQEIMCGIKKSSWRSHLHAFKPISFIRDSKLLCKLRQKIYFTKI